MTIMQIQQFIKRILEEEKVLGRKFFILGLNRDNPGFGDDLALVTQKTASFESYAGNPVREQPVRCPPDSKVVIPEDAQYFRPGTIIEVSYGDGTPEEEILVEDDDEKDVRANAYRIQTGRPDQDIFFRINPRGDGVELVEDFIRLTLVCWNTGSLPITVDGKSIPAGEYLILRPNDSSDPRRKNRRLRHEDIMSLPILDSEQQIAKTEDTLLARGCPAGDAHVLAAYFCRDLVDSVEDYDPADHDEWMAKTRI